MQELGAYPAILAHAYGYGLYICSYLLAEVGNLVYVGDLYRQEGIGRVLYHLRRLKACLYEGCLVQVQHPVQALIWECPRLAASVSSSGPCPHRPPYCRSQPGTPPTPILLTRKKGDIDASHKASAEGDAKGDAKGDKPRRPQRKILNPYFLCDLCAAVPLCEASLQAFLALERDLCFFSQFKDPTEEAGLPVVLVIQFLVIIGEYSELPHPRRWHSL